MSPTIRCLGCGALVPDTDGPTHRSVLSAPGCWQLYAQLTAGSERTQLSVDRYAVQHPGVPGPQSSQSVCGHLMNLCRVVERGGDIVDSPRFLQRLTHRDYPWLTPPASTCPVTVVDLASASKTPAFTGVERRFAEGTWEAWSAHHPQIHRWLDDHRSLPPARHPR